MSAARSGDSPGSKQSPESLPSQDAKQSVPASSPVEKTQPSAAPQSAGKALKAPSNVTNDEKGVAGAEGVGKLTNAELKKRKQAEKAARRAQAKPQGPSQGQNETGKREQSADGGRKSGEAAQGTDGRTQHKRSPSSQKGIPVRPAQGLDKTPPVQLRKDTKIVALFGHLYGHSRRTGLAGANKDVHPAILALGLQMSSYAICGSSARCVATLLAFKKVIASYITPPHLSLPRHLTTHLSTQIDYLVSCRPLATSTGNAIRWLKLEISAVDPSEDESLAKADLCDSIDRFIQERITLADRAIASTAVSKIEDGDTVLTFGKSNIVQQTLLAAYHEGKRFQVIVVDSRPLFEGRNIARTLANSGLDVQYTLVHGLARVINSTSRVLLGAHSMLGNGRLYARAGSALVAMMAKHADVPVIVCCESIKFTDRVALDSIVTNEIAPPEELIVRGEGGKKGTLEDWRDKAGLQMLNLMYDVTPADYVAIVVTEYGCLPPSSVPVVHRLSTNT